MSSEKAARSPAELDEHLNLVAKALSTVISVYSVTLNGEPVILSPEEVARGRFLDGAQAAQAPAALNGELTSLSFLFATPRSAASPRG